ncbi:isocitrate/isopropylmalate dehydrogenase family protein [Limibacillus sp. MBR-115]|jgi:3-isopropylmalate dehydrogenase|uniref:isocitrate/isopropylmalate dehydrogenase family protein n=1 Tax=Limibacillus sp. MBR-115 TaxID=3156465 RepID=UPI003397CE07
MQNKKELKIAVMPGDGIGLEVTPVCVELLQKIVQGMDSVSLAFEEFPSGAACYRDTGESLPARTLERARESDAILLGAMGLPDVRYPDGTEIVPQIEIREILGLFAGVRPIRPLPGLPVPLASPSTAEIDFVLIREQTEGLFAERGKTLFERPERATDVLRITREGSERLFRFSFDLACERKAAGFPGKVTLIDKANVLGTMAFFREIFDEVAEDYPGIVTERCYVDAMAMNMVKRPWDYDVMVSENMFGDILSDLAAALVGGLGVAPSADIGADNAVFQPCHGTAPDIMGTGKANPTAMILSGAMMLEWLGNRHRLPELSTAGRQLHQAVDRAFADGALLPFEFGGQCGTQAIADRVAQELDALRS